MVVHEQTPESRINILVRELRKDPGRARADIRISHQQKLNYLPLKLFALNESDMKFINLLKRKFGYCYAGSCTWNTIS